MGGFQKRTSCPALRRYTSSAATWRREKSGHCNGGRLACVKQSEIALRAVLTALIDSNLGAVAPPRRYNM